MGTPVSGPGQFSARTDKAVQNANTTLPDAQYGENRDYQEQKSGAAMGKTPGGDADFSQLFGNPASRVIGLDQPSQEPNTPVTSGADAGAGPGSEALGLEDQQSVDLQGIIPYLPVLEFMANQPGASWAMRNVVRKAKSMRQ